MPPRSGSSASSVAQLAELLKTRLASKMPCVLFLGSRASMFARENSKLLEFIKQFDPSPILWDSMQMSKRFSRAYTLLEQQGFAPSDLHAILQQARGTIEPSPADHSLGFLIKLGYFDTVITTNIDNLLDVCLDAAKLREGIDYALYIRKRDDQNIESALKKPFQRPACQVIKLFGDFLSNRYIIGNRWSDLERDKDMKDFLESLLTKDTIVVGLDSVWEDGFDRILPYAGNSLWYVNDELPTQFSPHVVRALKERKGKYIAGPEGDYNNFFRALQWQLFPGMPPNYELTQEITRLHDEIAILHEKIDQIIRIVSEMSFSQGQKP